MRFNTLRSFREHDETTSVGDDEDEDEDVRLSLLVQLSINHSTVFYVDIEDYILD